jgi:hypothetical protein
MVVLDKYIGDAEVGKFLPVVCLQEKAPRVADNFRLEFPDPRK